VRHVHKINGTFNAYWSLWSLTKHTLIFMCLGKIRQQYLGWNMVQLWACINAPRTSTCYSFPTHPPCSGNISSYLFGSWSKNQPRNINIFVILYKKTDFISRNDMMKNDNQRELQHENNYRQHVLSINY